MNKLLMPLTVCTWIFCFGIALAGPSAQAGILIEPYIGYFAGKSKQATQTTLNVKGPGYGARLGYTKLGFMIGLDYQTGSQTNDASPNHFDLTPTNVGAFVGYQLPILLRAYAGYNFIAKVKGTNPSNHIAYSGNGVKVGVGFTALPLVSINIEYLLTTFDHDDDGNQALTNKINSDMVGLTVSLPLDL